ncbi:zinc finger BED domain-containing protein RICESLEEPER 2-like [Vicia villosa]|uniref:zinc finger BED domain-containing protein RICESLEEPER 2-like n=1 Tax=Vicia villosa TaxID=3911 RepID=UPI00273C6232|nr:zinc finger BED domain-containing protein RICESLEEPER 2-like [Vicia villosa]
MPSSNPTPALENDDVPIDSSQPEHNLQVNENDQDHVIEDSFQKTKRKRKKTSPVWNDFDEVEIEGGVKKAVCRYCKYQFATGGLGSSTSHLKRHSQICMQRKLHMTKEAKQTVIRFQPSNQGNPFMSPGDRYTNEKMREIVATAIMVHEHPFSVVEEEVWMWAFQYANSDFHKIGRKTAREDCLRIYEEEKKILKALLRNIGKISITTDMWRSSHQVAEYMVITGHFIDSGWKLQKRVLSFVKIPAPRRGIDVADAIFKCLKSWGIENKIFSVSVDNASYNDSCLKSLKEDYPLSRMLVLGGALFHVRCCAHVINLLVQDGLSQIKDVIGKVRESVKYINHNDARLKAFCDVVEQKGLKDRKLILDCPTRWNSTYHMLSAALKFKIAFPSYKEREPHYKYAPSTEDWENVEKVCQFLEVFNLATVVISGSEYPTSNLYLVEVWRVKQVIDNAAEDTNSFMREMAASMKLKFDKYWGECNLLMAIASVLDPRSKFHTVNICFPLIYKAEVAQENIEKVKNSLEELYAEYVSLSLQESSSNEVHTSGINSSSSSTQSQSLDITGFDRIMSIVREKEAVPAVKSELQTYLDEGVYIPDGNNNSFCVLEWWRNNSLKYKILSKMAADILAVPISTVASSLLSVPEAELLMNIALN